MLTFFTDYLAYLLVIYAFYRFARTGNKLIIYVPILSVLLSTVISSHSGIPRPFVVLGFEPLTLHTADGSFPSDHSSLVFALAVSLGEMWVWLAAFTVAVARIYAGIHWPIDILGSLALVFVVNYSIRWFYENKCKSSSGGKNRKSG